MIAMMSPKQFEDFMEHVENFKNRATKLLPLAIKYAVAFGGGWRSNIKIDAFIEKSELIGFDKHYITFKYEEYCGYDEYDREEFHMSTEYLYDQDFLNKQEERYNKILAEREKKAELEMIKHRQERELREKELVNNEKKLLQDLLKKYPDVLESNS